MGMVVCSMDLDLLPSLVDEFLAGHSLRSCASIEALSYRQFLIQFCVDYVKCVSPLSGGAPGMSMIKSVKSIGLDWAVGGMALNRNTAATLDRMLPIWNYGSDASASSLTAALETGLELGALEDIDRYRNLIQATAYFAFLVGWKRRFPDFIGMLEAFNFNLGGALRASTRKEIGVIFAGLLCDSLWEQDARYILAASFPEFADVFYAMPDHRVREVLSAAAPLSAIQDACSGASAEVDYLAHAQSVVDETKKALKTR
ncbi:hypothetical protein A3709_19750 [Halioglobus sp. HI00S01]|uniref:hypothetical protein n=1 Tax=Halioglobus sp. HI00S01 TaxID=1822214 RepID=UPI0007C2E469|nr:hypothetical protein [Halioglobus sp. HI00S01]KZX57861.1 hypothetical protein A3709_19750 [Halioglobus sp. HI00S01]